MADIDSKPCFLEMLRSRGLLEEHIRTLTAGGIETVGTMAYCCGYTPGLGDEGPFVEWAGQILGPDLPMGQLACLRRIFYECHVMCNYRLKEGMERQGEDQSNAIPPEDRRERHRQQQDRLKGLPLTGEYECSSKLLELVQSQVAGKVIRYIHPKECTSMQAELQSSKRIKTVQADTQGVLRVHTQAGSSDAPVHTDLLLKDAMMRRALAYDQLGVFTFEVQSRWIHHIFGLLYYNYSLPPDGCKSITTGQLLNADKALFLLISAETSGNIKEDEAGARPCDAAMVKLMWDSRVAFHLLPLPAAMRTTSGAAAAASDSVVSKSSGPKGKGSGKKRVAPPDGCLSRTPDGKNICFTFNSAAGCRYAKAGKRCQKGYHICGRASCHGGHSMLECPKVASN
eukprot:6468890-Amphidinium_carterae.1